MIRDYIRLSSVEYLMAAPLIELSFIHKIGKIYTLFTLKRYKNHSRNSLKSLSIHQKKEQKKKTNQ